LGVITALNMAVLFRRIIIIFEHSLGAHWWICPILARV